MPIGLWMSTADSRSMARMRPLQPWSVPFARLAVIGCGLLLLLAIFNAFVNTGNFAAWLPLLIFMPWPLYLGIWSLRNQNRT